LEKHIRLSCGVASAFLKDSGKWIITTKETSGDEVSETYDACVVANGHFAKLLLPKIFGLDTFIDSLSHSQSFRDASIYAGKNVIVVNGSYSGQDIVREVSKTTAHVYFSVRDSDLEGTEIPVNAKATKVTIISDLVSISGGTVQSRFSENKNVGAIIFATGYLYSFPFLDPSINSIPITDGQCVNELFLHLFHRYASNLCFVALPHSIVPFHLAEYQAELISAVYSGRVELPSLADMEEIEKTGGIGGAADAIPAKRHVFGTEVMRLLQKREFLYCDYLADIYGGEKVPEWRIDLRRNFKQLRKKYLFGVNED
jgi:Flavin-binding monooxygenase-like